MKKKQPPQDVELQILLPKRKVEVKAVEKSKEIKRKTSSSPIRLGTASAHFPLAVKALEYARRFVKKSSTEMINNQRKPEQFHALRIGVRSVREYAVEKAAELDSLKVYGKAEILDYLEYVMHIEAAKKFSLGNCGELAILVLDFFYEQQEQNGFEGLVEVVNIIAGEHEIAVIGRASSSDPEDFHSWGEHALVCDPWSNRIYPASQIPHYLEVFKGDYELNSEGLPVAKFQCLPFDPIQHSLKPFFNLKMLSEAREILKKTASLYWLAIHQPHRVELAEQLVIEGASWTIKDDKGQPLEHRIPRLRHFSMQKMVEAVRANQLLAVQHWQKRDPTLLHAVDDASNTLLHLAAQHNSEEVFRYLLSQNLDLCKRNQHGQFIFESDLPFVNHAQATIKTALVRFAFARINDAEISFSEGAALTLTDQIIKTLQIQLPLRIADFMLLYQSLLEDRLRQRDLDPALLIFNAFPEMMFSPHQFLKQYLDQFPAYELSNAIRNLKQNRDISATMQSILKIEWFRLSLYNPAYHALRDALLEEFSDDLHFLNLQDEHGRTVLHEAALKGEIEVIQFLLDKENPVMHYIDPLSLQVDKTGKKADELEGIDEKIRTLLQVAVAVAVAEIRKATEVKSYPTSSSMPGFFSRSIIVKEPEFLDDPIPQPKTDSVEESIPEMTAVLSQNHLTSVPPTVKASTLNVG